MEQDLSTYPPTKKGTQDIVRALTPAIRTLWRAEREQHQTDDLVVIIDTQKNTLRMRTRLGLCAQLKRHNHSMSLLKDLRRPTPPGGHSTLRIWALIGFTEGPVFTASVTLAPG
jgi:hypothetical protein